ncbi:MAG TPA: DNA/RNA nuclease SfsA [Thermoclostridium sp.]|nr:DNA/RNA nuclease SfsA [Thermoclostridium sp.]
MEYNKIVEGTFKKRPNRFIAQVIIDGKEETVHVKNTGRCQELLIPNAKVILEDCSHNLNRKTKYSLVAVWKDNMLVNMDSQAPNKVVFEGISDGMIKDFKDYTQLEREVTFGNSRFDIYFETENSKGFVEVKGVTLENDGISMFPDAPTERGTKHALEMVEAVRQGYRGVIFFLIQMKGPKVFKLNWEMDRVFSEAVKYATENGVEILAYDSIVNNSGICLSEPVETDLNF